ncbi:hypothetical protein BES34_013325 [Leptospira inadai serovar Lyme]|uniref:Lipoprotein n=1 Tax=Leptospira inadai serovar Lyme TaxID=293084 RepID=A0ABX4YH18_9LEPT|nr:hypothetical protein BES34_013325 [Leptospira inadai serovar Lyme]
MNCNQSSKESNAAALMLAALNGACVDAAVTANEVAETPIAAGINTFQLISLPAAGAARHFRIEGALIQALSGHGTIYLATGYTDGLSGTSSTPTTAAGDGRLVVNIYQGGPMVYAGYSASTAYGTDDGTATPALGGTGNSLFSSFTTTASDICFDISADTTPKLTVWGSGYKGANCKKRCTLTKSNAIINKADWPSGAGIGSTGSTSTYYKTGSSASGVTATKVVTYSITAL